MDCVGQVLGRIDFLGRHSDMGTRQSVIKDAVPLDLWPTVLDIEFEDEQREHFQAQVEAIRLYFSWVPVAQIEEQTGVHRTWLPKLAKRCLENAPDGRIQGFRACIPFARKSRYRSNPRAAFSWHTM